MTTDDFTSSLKCEPERAQRLQRPVLEWKEMLLTSGRVVFESKVDVFLDTKAEASRVGEVFALELILLHLQPSLKDLQRLVAPDLDGQRPTSKHIRSAHGQKNTTLSNGTTATAGLSQ